MSERYLDPAYRAQLVYDPRTGIHVRPHHRHVNGQCGATDRGFFCTVKAGHDGWHAAYAGMAPKETLHIWLAEPLVAKESHP